MTLTVVEAHEVDQRLLDAFERLTPQLTSSGVVPGEDVLREIVRSTATELLMAELDGEYVGSLTLVLFRIPTGMRAWIEDVVVDEAVRGRGVGAALNGAAIERAQRAGARTVDLTSRPTREAANRLYQRLGFTERDTNVYRYESSA